MAGQIAAFVGQNGETALLEDKGELRIYRRKLGEWQIAREKEFSLYPANSLIEIRRNMEILLEFLHDCKIFVGLSLTGIPYYILEKAGCSIWECQGKPQDFLDYVLEKEELAKAKADPGENSNKPGIVETTPGCYYLSLSEIQGTDAPVTSKQILQPFIQKGQFKSLEVVCKHIPLWLEGEQPAGNIFMDVIEISKNEVKLIITRKD